MLYLFYDTITGRVISKYSGMNPDLQLVGMPNGTSYIEGDISGDAYILENTIVKVPEKPSDAHEWDWSAKEWVFSNELFCQMKTRLSFAVNNRAGEIITARLPIWKQNNMLARSIELQSKSEWTQEETSEWNFLQSEWDWVKSIRAASNVAVAAVTAATDVTQIEAAVNGFISGDY